MFQILSSRRHFFILDHLHYLLHSDLLKLHFLSSVIESVLVLLFLISYHYLNRLVVGNVQLVQLQLMMVYSCVYVKCSLRMLFFNDISVAPRSLLENPLIQEESSLIKLHDYFFT